MPRPICLQCQRPKTTCICDLFIPINNQIPIIILQHPTEAKQSKGSLPLLANSLNFCTIIQGENFSNNKELQQKISQYKNNVYLLYPEKQTSITLGEKTLLRLSKQVHCLILLDATWKKAYRMYQLSNNLHALPKLQLPLGLTNHYEIRTTRVDNGLSTLEACCYALSMLEHKPHKYQPLFERFITFNQRLLSFRPKIQK